MRRPYVFIVVGAGVILGAVVFKTVRDRDTSLKMVEQICERLDQLSNDALKSDDTEQQDTIGEIKDLCRDRTPIED